MNERNSKDVVWHEHMVKKDDLERLHGHKGVTVWFTGLPSSGKSTIANSVAAELYKMGVSVFVLDGDNIRHGLNSNLGFSPEDRTENIRRIGEVAKLFTSAGIVNLTAFISPYASDRDLARSLQPETFVEVFCDCNLNECERRDPKGMYARARRGEMRGFTGVDAPYETPARPEFVVKTGEWPVSRCTEAVVSHLSKRGFVNAPK